MHRASSRYIEVMSNAADQSDYLACRSAAGALAVGDFFGFAPSRMGHRIATVIAPERGPRRFEPTGAINARIPGRGQLAGRCVVKRLEFTLACCRADDD